jgi:DNA-binding transcriptional ArsR family regulator
MKPNKEKLEKAAFVLKSIAHPTRLWIICLLEKHEELHVNQLCELTGCEQSLLSHHLSNLKLKGILSARREGVNVYYQLKEKNIIPVLNCIDKCNV